MRDRDYCLTRCPVRGDAFAGCAGEDYIAVHPNFRPECCQTQDPPDYHAVVSRFEKQERAINRLYALAAMRSVEVTERPQRRHKPRY